MPKKVVPLKRVSWNIGIQTVLAGKRASLGTVNPYRRYTTRWYVWRLGHQNRRVAADELLTLIKKLGYPVSDKEENSDGVH